MSNIGYDLNIRYLLALSWYRLILLTLLDWVHHCCTLYQQCQLTATLLIPFELPVVVKELTSKLHYLYCTTVGDEKRRAVGMLHPLRDKTKGRHWSG